MLWDFQTQSDGCKRKHLRDANGVAIKRYYYLWFIATDAKAQGQGLASNVIVRWQDKAAKEGYSIWIEATTEKSRNTYMRLGCEVVQEMCLGKGTHDASGAIHQGGSGVPFWALIWRPDFREKESSKTSEADG